MSLIDRFLGTLGINPVQLKWRIHRYRERTRRAGRQAENRRRALTYQHKVCHECGLTVDSGEKACPRCGTRLTGMFGRRLGMLWRSIAPRGAFTYTTIFVVVNVAFFLAMIMQAGGFGEASRGLDPELLVRFGAWTVGHVAQGELWRLVTPMFLHFGLLHIIFNCLWLLQLGPQIEGTYGRSRYLVLYLGSGVAGFVASVTYHWLVGTNAVGGGASGVVFGLMAAALVQGFIKRAPGTEVYRSDLVKWVILGVIISLLPGVDLAAHAGGFVGGGLLGLALADRHAPRRLSDRLWRVIEVVTLALLVLSFIPLVLGGG